MRPAVDITAELISSGLTPGQTSLLMELVLSMSTGLSTGQGGENRAILNRRAWDRDRKQRDREAARLSAMSTGHPPDSTGNQVENAELRPTEGKTERGLQVQGKKQESKKGSRLLIGARVSDDNRAIAVKHGCPPDRVDGLWSEFVDYWSDIPGQKGRKLSWTGTWRNRVKFVFERGISNGKTSTGNGGSIIAALDRALEQSVAEDADLAAPAYPLLSFSR